MSKKIFNYFQLKPNLTDQVNSSEDYSDSIKIKQEIEEDVETSHKVTKTSFNQQKSVHFDQSQFKIKNKVQENPTKVSNNIKIEAERQFLVILPTSTKPKTTKVKKEPKSATINRLKCEFCNLSYGHNSSLKTHIIRTHPDKYQGSLFNCEICNSNFLTKIRLDEHFNRVHEKNEQYQCDFDGKIFKDKQIIRNHMLCHLPKVKCQVYNLEFRVSSFSDHMKAIHGQKKEFECKICSKTFKTSKYLQRHEQRHNKLFDCDNCCKKFQSLAHLTRHDEFYHKNPKSFSCELCDKKFNKKYNLQCHQQRIHGVDKVKSFACKLCNFVSNDRKSFNVHQNIHKCQNKKFECDFDGQMFDNKMNLHSHMRIHRLKVQCKICHIFLMNSWLSTHMRTVHAENRDFKCDICSKSYKTKKFLKIHQKIHNKNFNCIMCGKMFPTQCCLNKHKKNNHENPGSFECEMCGKRFNTKKNLKDHQKTHDKNRPKPFKCQRCVYSTDVNAHLRLHQKSHLRLDEKFSKIKSSIKCQECPRTCKNKEALRSHMKSVHPKYLRQCDLCGNYFKSMDKIRRHLKSFHKWTSLKNF